MTFALEPQTHTICAMSNGTSSPELGLTLASEHHLAVRIALDTMEHMASEKVSAMDVLLAGRSERP